MVRGISNAILEPIWVTNTFWKDFSMKSLVFSSLVLLVLLFLFVVCFFNMPPRGRGRRTKLGPRAQVTFYPTEKGSEKGKKTPLTEVVEVSSQEEEDVHLGQVLYFEQFVWMTIYLKKFHVIECVSEWCYISFLFVHYFTICSIIGFLW